MPFFETSAKTSINVQEIFERIAIEIKKKSSQVKNENRHTVIFNNDKEKPDKPRCC